MASCSNCGREIPEDVRFCPECGAPRSTATQSKAGKSRQTPPEDSGKTMLRQQPVYGIVNLENLPAGHIIDARYEIKEKLGQGGFGAVYRAFDRKMKVDKALKVIPEAVGNDLRAMATLSREAQTMIRLNHPNMVRVYDFHDQGQIKYIDMEYVAGKSLSDLLLDYPDQRMPEPEVTKLASQIAEGLAYAHNDNVIHRDIKPHNLMLTGDGQIKIMDFGIAETLRTSMSRLAPTSTSGTLAYMSPEQLLGKDLGVESDIYSLGATLYELLSGHPPFYRGDIQYQVLNEPVKEIQGCSEFMNSLLQRCLAKSAEDRFPSCDSLIQALNENILPKQKRRKAKARRVGDSGTSPQEVNGWKPVVAAVALGLIVAAGIMLSNRADQTAGKHPEIEDEAWDGFTELEKDRIQSLLALGDSLFVENRLVRPPGRNAYEAYNEALMIHPTNAYAGKQLDLILKDFVRRADRELVAGNYHAASSIAREGLQYFAQDSTLVQLKLQSRVLELEEQARRYARAEQYVSPESENAYSVSRELLRLESENTTAQRILGDIEQWFMRRGDNAAQNGQWQQAMALYRKSLQYFPDERQLTMKLKAAEEEVQRLQEQKRQAAEAKQRQAEQARRRFEDQQRKMLWKGFVYVEGGTFEMGCTREQSDCGDDEKPAHRVTVKSFYMSKHEVTQKEWREVMGDNPSAFEGDDMPANEVSWYNVVEFCNKKSLREGLTPAYKRNGHNVACDFSANGYRLPTEAEWEYACRGGRQSAHYQYSGSNDPDEVAWYTGNSGDKTHPVGGKRPNELGLYDLSGNVWEWCWDRYSGGYYKNSPANNPKGPDSGWQRVLRGGSFRFVTSSVRSAYRDGHDPLAATFHGGFRCVRSVL